MTSNPATARFWRRETPRQSRAGITGATGMRIIRAIVAGERDPEVLAAFRDIRCHSSIEVIKAALVGNDRDEHIFALTHSLDLYDFYQTKIEDCDRKLEVAVAALIVRADGNIPALPRARTKHKQISAPSFDMRAALYGVLGTDLTQIHGLGPSLALKLVAECGTDLLAWKSAKHFTSWLCLAPGNKIAGGKLLSSRTRRSSSRTAALLRLAATTIGRSDAALGAFYRRLSSRIGKQKAVTATLPDGRLHAVCRVACKVRRDPGPCRDDRCRVIQLCPAIRRTNHDLIALGIGCGPALVQRYGWWHTGGFRHQGSMGA